MNRIKIFTCLTLICQFLLQPSSAQAASPVVQSEAVLTPSIAGVGNIWTGKVPTKIAFPTDTYCGAADFQIEGLLPYSVLADRALGVKVEFEIWSSAGKKVAYDNVYSSSWNPTGPKTAVSISLPSDCAGSFTLLVRTIYETSTNGLLSRYLSDEKKLPIEFTGGRKGTSNVSTIQTTVAYTSSITSVGSLWSAQIPTAITLPNGSFSSYLEFQVQAIKPFSYLANRSTGTSIEFEIWDSSGKKIANDSLSSYDWNPIASNSLAQIYLGSEVGPGTYSFIVRTIDRTSSDGLLSSYLKTETTQTLVISGTPRVKATTPQLLSTNAYTSNIAGVGNIWTGSLPKQVQLPESSYSKLEFTIKGLLPISVLADRALGVEVDFEIWSELGTKVASTTVYSDDWNTKSPDTLVSLTLFSDRFNAPTTLRVITTYATRTNGLLTSYLEDVDNFQISVLGKSSVSSDLAKVDKDAAFVSNVRQVGNIWKGAIPTQLTLPKSSYSTDIQFQIEGLIPYKVLADRSLGVSVEFEIWSDEGEKIADDNVYPSEWNPVGPNTLVSMRIPSEGVAGIHTLLIRTIYETNTNGVQSGYWESKSSQKIEIAGGTPKSADGHKAVESRSVTGSITGVGSIWTGNIPSKIALSSGRNSSPVTFQIQSILPYSVLADRSTGTNVEFEIWSKAGEKVTSEDISAYDWSPVGTKTLGKLYIWSSMVAGNYTMIVRTIYKTRSNGLLSNYLKDEKTFPFEVVNSGKIVETTTFWDMNLSQKSIPNIVSRFSSNNKNTPIVVVSSTPTVCAIQGSDLNLLKKGSCILTANQKGSGSLYDATPYEVEFDVLSSPPSRIDNVESSLNSKGATYSWSAPTSDEKITKYEIGFSASRSANLTSNLSASYFDYTTMDSTVQTSYSVTSEQIYNFLRSIPSASSIAGMHFRVSVRAVSDAGTSVYWGWNYLEASELKASFWSKHPSSFDLKETTTNGKYYFSASPNQASSNRLVGNADKYSWRFSVAPAGSDFAKYAYDPKGVEVASTSVNSILEDDLYLSLEKFQTSFPTGGAVLIMVYGTANGVETLDTRGTGIYFSTQDLLNYIDDTKKSIAAAKAAAELKAKQEAEAAAAKAAAELKAKQEAEAAAKAAAELKAKQEAEAAAKAAAELKAKQEAEAAAAKAAAELKAKQEAEAAAKAAAELKAKQEAAAKATASKKTTVTCVKGNLTKKFSGTKCPTGYKIKR
jgi:hypothetical protein